VRLLWEFAVRRERCDRYAASSTTSEGLIGFDFGRSIQEKRVEDPGLSRKRSLETISADSKRTDFALAA
jgi:hypothetical protein